MWSILPLRKLCSAFGCWPHLSPSPPRPSVLLGPCFSTGTRVVLLQRGSLSSYSLSGWSPKRGPQAAALLGLCPLSSLSLSTFHRVLWASDCPPPIAQLGPSPPSGWGFLSSSPTAPGSPLTVFLQVFSYTCNCQVSSARTSLTVFISCCLSSAVVVLGT